MKEYIDQFLTYLSVEKGFSDNTLDAYKNDLSQLVTFVEEESAKKGTAPSWESFTRQDMLSYQLQLKERNYAATTLARKVAAAKSFFKFMVADGPISHAKVMKLLEQPAKLSTPEARRDKAMLHLLYASGMRVSELISLNLGDVDTEGDTVRCFGKGQKERIIPIYRQAALAVEEYLKDARPHLARSDAEKAMFLNRRGERLTRQGFWQILKGHAKAAGLEEEITPHTLRHSFATNMLSGGADLRSVQELLGHANISTTQVYTHLTSEHVRRSYEKSHPRAR